MLSTVNQHKSGVKTESVRSITFFSKAASRFSLRKTPEFFYSALPMSVALSMGIVLTGCGVGNNPTTRVDTPKPPSSTARTSYDLTVQSPVFVSNVKVTVTDTATGGILGQSIIKNGNEAVFAIPLEFLKAGNVLLMTLSPVDSSSKYFDPMLNNTMGSMTTFNKTLHALVSVNKIDTAAKIDPFSEIVYERALIRSGVLDISKPRLHALTTSHLMSAGNEMTSALGTDETSTFSVVFNSPGNIAAINLYGTSTTATKPVNQQASSTLIALGQLALYAQNNPTALTPYLDFSTRASLDLRDGDLDGLTTVGGDTVNTVRITNPILYSGVISDINNDPDQNSLSFLIPKNTEQRNKRGLALKQATIQYFNNLNASLALASRTDNASLDYMQRFDFGIFSLANTSAGFGSTAVPTNLIGAGNYTPAFGLPTGTNFKNALDASDDSDRSIDLLQLNGIYQGNDGCQLSIGYEGTIQLSKGSQTYQAAVNRKFTDSLTRISGNQYVLNVTSADLTSPRFIQIRTVGAQIISADAGRSTEQFPTTLETKELGCTF